MLKHKARPAAVGPVQPSCAIEDWRHMAWAAAGIWLMTGAAFAMNCLFVADRDARMARMARTARRATAAGEPDRAEVCVFASQGRLSVATCFGTERPCLP